MRPKSDIEALLNHLQILYDNPINSSHQHYYAKLALFELCGWLEGVFDELVQNHANSKLITLDCIQRYAEIIKKTHGCDYKKHLCPLLRNLIGIVNVEKIEIILRDT